jgi:serine phosphatase RsbU (regulator of sigma subunit)
VALKSDMTDLRSRFEEIAARLGEEARAHAGAGARQAAEALKEDYWKSVQDLFTRDVTGRGLQQLVEEETRDTFQFFTREVDLQSLQARPWYERYPLGVWRVFLAMAYRLSPWRRVLFAVAVPFLALGWIRYVFTRLAAGFWSIPPVRLEDWLLVASTLLFFLLVLELRDKLGLKGDLEIARQIQFGLLPFQPYEKSGVKVASAMRPANTVGGDYFDIIELPEGRLALVMGDVAGKGMPAALLMALLQGSLRTLITAGMRGSELIAKLNAHLCANIPSNRLITLFYGELEPDTGRLRYVNAGHNPPFLLHGAEAAEQLAATGLALGIVADAPFEVGDTRLAGGDRLFLYTDGVTEAFDPRDEEYGETRLRTFLESQRGTPHRALVDGVIANVLLFCGTARPRDDMTLMCVERA